MIKLIKINELYHRIETEVGISREINEFFSFFVEGYRFMPKYKNGMWDGKIKLFDYRTGNFYTGLIPDLIEFAKTRNYEIKFQELPLIDVKEDYRLFENKIPEICNLTPYDYQLELTRRAIIKNKAIVSSSTGSGKSLLIWLYSRFILDVQFGNILLVVPTVSLVEQMRKDFVSYNKDYNIDKDIYCITSGVPKDIHLLKKRIVISTWQSIYKLPKSWYDYFNSNSEYPGRGAVIFDECHLLEGASLNKIVNNCSDFVFKMGCSGSIKSSKIHLLQLKALIGNVIKVNTTKDLMDRKILSDLEIHNITFHYSKEDKLLFVKNSDYKTELSFITNHEKRNNLICDIARKESGNILLLFNFIEHGQYLFNNLKDCGKKIFYIDGSTKAEERERVRIFTEANDDVILVCSSGTFSTGVNIKKLNTVIFTHPYKSFVKNIQSIGRILRLHESKKIAKLIDICDDLTLDKKLNFAALHSIERRKIYKAEQFNIKDFELNL